MKSLLALLILAAAVTFLVGAIALAGWMELDLHGRHTPYCPKLHQRGDLRSCYVLDDRGDRALIQHAELDGNRCYFEIRAEGKSAFYAMPDSIVRFAPQGYSARLLEDTTGIVEIDGKQVKLVEIATPSF